MNIYFNARQRLHRFLFRRWKRKLIFTHSGIITLFLVWSVAAAGPYLQAVNFHLISEVQAAQATVDSTAGTNVTMNASSPNMVVVSSTNAYIFYVDSTGRCSYSKTTTLNNATPTWGAAVIVDNQTDCIHLAVWYDRWTPGDTTGNYIYIITQDSGNDDLWFNRLDTSTDTLLGGTAPTAISSSTGPALTDSFTNAGNVPSITKGSDGVIYAGAPDNTGSWVLKCSTSCNTASNWSDTSLSFGGITLNDNDSMMLVPTLNGEIFAIYMVDSADDMLAQKYSSSGTAWTGAWTTIDANFANNTTYDGNYGAVVDSASGNIYLAYAADNSTLGTNDDIRTARYSQETDTWTNTTDVFTNSGTRAPTGVKVSMDQNTGTIYVVYTARTTAATAATGNIYYVTSTDNMATWSAESATINSAAADIYGANVNVLSDQRIYVNWWASSGILGNTVAALAPISSSVEQAVFRIFNNANSTDVGSALAASNTAATLTSKGQAFRIRMLLKVTTANLSSSGQSFRLQFANKGAGTCAAPTTMYRDVTTTSKVAYVNNASPSDGAGLTANANDPTNGADTIVNQTYEETNNFTNSQGAINTGQDGKWDFALVDNGANAADVYCFRVVKAGGALINTYTQYPQVTIANAPTLDQSNFRFFANNDSTSVGSALAAQNTNYTLTAPTQQFRLRMIIGFSGSGALAGGQGFKLQFAEKGAGSCSSPTGSYIDITTISDLAYFDNTTPTDGSALTSSGSDPTSSNTVINQTYEEVNNFNNSQGDINAGEDGMWDFSLRDLNLTSTSTYCIRAVTASGAALDTYTQYPEITSMAGVIDKSPDTTNTDYQNTGSNIVFISDQVGYVFYLDSDHTAVYRKTSNGGTSWGTPVTVDSQTDIASLDVWYDRWTPGDTTGTKIHIVTADIGNDDLWYTSLDTSGDTLTTTVSTVANTAQGGSITTASSLPSITKGTDGNLYTGLLDNGDAYVTYCTATCTAQASWNEAGTVVPAPSADSLVLRPLAGGNILGIDWDKTNNVLQSGIWNGTAWGSAATIDATAPENTTYDAGLAATVNTTNNDVYLAWVNDTNTLGTNDDIQTAIYSGGTWTNTADILTNNTRGITDVKIARDTQSGDIYVIYSVQTTAGTASTGQIYYKKSTDNMATWGTEQGPINYAQTDIWSPQVNLMSDERLYVDYFDNTNAVFYGVTLADITAPTPTPTPTGPTATPTLTPTPLPYATPTLVQSTIQANTTSGTSKIVSFPGSVTSGNLVVVSISHWSAANDSTITSITDNKGNTYQKAVSQPTTESGANEPVAIWYAYNVVGGSSFQVTVNNANSAYMTITLNEYGGFGTSDPLDKTVSDTGSGTAGNTGNTATTTQATELLFAAFNHGSGDTTATQGTNYTMREFTNDNSTTEAIYTEDRTVTSTGAYNATITFAGSVAWRGALATFKTSSTGGGPTNTPTPSLTPTAVPNYPYHTPMYEQSSTNFSTSTNTIDITFSNPVKNGNTVVVAIAENDLGNASVSSVTDNKGNTYTKILSQPATEIGTNTPLVLYYAYNVTGGSNLTVTVTNSSGNANMAVIIQEYSGLDTNNPLDKFTSADSSSSSSVSSGATTTTTQNDELVLGIASVYNGSATVTAGSGYTMRQAYTSSYDMYWEDKNINSTGAQTATFDVSTFLQTEIAVVTFKAAPGPQNDQLMRHGKYFDSNQKKFWPFGF